MSRDTSATARTARVRQKIQGQQSDGGVQLNKDGSHWLQKRLGRTIFFNQTLNGVTTDVPCACIYATDTESIVVTGSFFGTATFNNADGSAGATLTATDFEDAFVVKYNLSGVVQWATKIGSAVIDVGRSVAIDNEKNIIAVGYFNSTATFYNPDGSTGATLTDISGVDAYVVKYNSSGVVQWATKIRSDGEDEAFAVAIDSSNNIVVTGEFGDTATFFNSDESTGATLTDISNDDVFVVQYNSLGFVQWATKIRSVDYESSYSVANDSSNNIVVTGVFQNTATFFNSDGSSGGTLTDISNEDVFVVQYNSLGFVQWATKIRSVDYESSFGVAIDSSNNIVVTGEFEDVATFFNSDGSSGATLTTTGGYDAYVVQYNSSGFVQWTTQIGSVNSDRGRSVTIDSLNNIVVTGEFRATATFFNSDGSSGATLTVASGDDGFVVKYNSLGFVQWVTKIETAGSDDGGIGIANDSANNIIVTGNFNSIATFYDSNGVSSGKTVTATGDDNRYLVKYNASGFVQWALVAGQTAGNEIGKSIAVR